MIPHVSLSIVLAGCAGGDPVDGPTVPDPVPTTTADTGPADTEAWREWEDIPAILEARCTECHTEGGVAPFTLNRWEDAKTFAFAMQAAIENDSMPPWPAGPADIGYRDSRDMPAAERERVLAWIDADSPEWGDPPRELSPVGAITLPRVDARLDMAEGFVPKLSPDDIRCFLVEAPEELTGWVVGARIVPGNLAIAHHANFVQTTNGDHYRILDAQDPEPGWDCNLRQPGVSGKLADWLPGQAPLMLPEGTGLEIEPNAEYVLVIHYWTPGYDGIPDQSYAELMIEPTVDRAAEYLTLHDPRWSGGVLLGAGEYEATNQAKWSMQEIAQDLTSVDGSKGILVHSALAHMHVYGSRARMSRIRGTGEMVLLDIDNWSFDWQLEYFFEDPVELRPGDHLGVQCTHTSDGEPVMWGDGSEEEMCNGKFLVTEPDPGK